MGLIQSQQYARSERKIEKNSTAEAGQMAGYEIFVTGGTGYLGSHLIPRLLERGHRVRALVRPSSEGKIAPKAQTVAGDALNASYAEKIPPCDTFVHLVGVSHPTSAKAKEFRLLDLAATRVAIAAALAARVRHFVYISVAQPAPVMKEYQQVRAECEAAIRASGLNATILRPWYVLGPGHRWPYLIVPLYWLMYVLPGTRDLARRIGLVTVDEMIGAIANAIETPCFGVRTFRVIDIRDAGSDTARGR
jgi:nucleoside-diphosphate-sugar epimerase